MKKTTIPSRYQFTSNWLRTGNDLNGNRIDLIMIGGKNDTYDLYIKDNFMETKSNNTVSYLWIYDGSDCPKCSQLDGRVFDTMPDKKTTSHPGCKCRIEEINQSEAEERKKENRENIEKRDSVAKSLRDNVKVKNQDGDWVNPRTGAKEKNGQYGDCARYVSDALEKGGVNVREHRNTNRKEDPTFDSAYRYGEYLEKEGFKKISSGQGKISESYEPQKGDVSVIQPPKDGTHKHGHMAMHDGKQWISDQPQEDMWGGRIRDKNAKYTAYRNPKWNEW